MGRKKVELIDCRDNQIKETEKKYWLKAIPADLITTNIRLDFDRPAEYQREWDRQEIIFDIDLSNKINTLTNNDAFLLYSLLMTALKICMYRYTERPQITIGSPILKTNDALSINDAIPIITVIDAAMTFRQYLLMVRSVLLKSYNFQNYPLQDIYEDLGIEEMQNKNSLFDIALELTNIHNLSANVKNDMTFQFTKQNSIIAGVVFFHPNLFHANTINHLTDIFMRILTRGVANTEMVISDLLRGLDEEEQSVIREWNSTEVEYLNGTCLHELFESQVRWTPDAIAVCCNDLHLTYNGLNERSNKLAHYLRTLHVGPDVPVGLFLDPSLDMIVGLLGVLKAGGAYVPIDPSYPKDRLTTMLDSVSLPVLITRMGLLTRLPDYGGQVICIDRDWPVIEQKPGDNLPQVVSERNLAYIIFTSGSTGTPKAAAVYHRGWNNLLNWFTHEFAISRNDKVLIISSFSFDITQRSIAMPLINGGELHLIATDYFEPNAIVKTISDKGITVLNSAPSSFYPLIEKRHSAQFERIKSLRYVFLGGEAISPARLMPWVYSEFCRAAIVNVYGAAECSDVSSFHILNNFERYVKSSVPIGKPIYNTQIYILDDNYKPVPIGVVGEICISGEGVGKGYINDPELTLKKFIPRISDRSNYYSQIPGAVFYRTGDLGRYLPDGTIEYAGRMDHQVKIRGLRIELGDIETAIRQHPNVKEAVVVEKNTNNGAQRLVAYIVPNEYRNNQHGQKSFDELTADVRRFAHEKLPTYMLPNALVILNELPVNPNGKIDRKSLQKNDFSSKRLEKKTISAKIAIEEVVIDNFSKILNVSTSEIQNNSNFFELGGHSLLAVQVIAALNDKYNIDLHTADLYIAPTASELAKRIEKANKKNCQSL